MFPGTVTYTDCNQGAIEVKLDGTDKTISVALKGIWFGQLPFVGDRILSAVDKNDQIISSLPIKQVGRLGCDLEEFAYCHQCSADTPHRRVRVTRMRRDYVFWVRLECTECSATKTERRKAEFVGRCSADRTERYDFCQMCAAITPWRVRGGICTFCEKRGVLVTIPRRHKVRKSVER